MEVSIGLVPDQPTNRELAIPCVNFYTVAR